MSEKRQNLKYLGLLAEMRSLSLEEQKEIYQLAVDQIRREVHAGFMNKERYISVLESMNCIMLDVR